jgi:tetratricopeptide (TPR) repeat protein
MDKRWASLRSAKMKATADEIELEIDNVRTAWDVMVERAQFTQIAKTARVLWWFLDVRTRIEDGIALFGQAVNKLRSLPAGEARDVTLGEALVDLGNFITLNGSPVEGKSLAEESLTFLQTHDVAEIILRAHIPLCLSDVFLGEYQESKRNARQGMALAHRLDDPWYRFIPVYFWSFAALWLGDYEEAYRAGMEALRYAEQTGDPHYQGMSYGLLLARAACRMERYDDARRYYLCSITHYEGIGHQFYIALVNGELCGVYALTKEYEAAERAYRKSLSYFSKAGPTYMIFSNLLSASRLLEARGEYVKAIEIMALLTNHPAALAPDVQLARAALTRMRPHLSAEDFAAAYERGKALDLEAVVAELLS